ncbi:acetyl-coenzyme A synthetase [Candidatus Pacearchaeota archaeon ex4484_71]|nr:MAG: acetyl-coenzyme A synthetase [Candidatus Pacearchaeota archaeon ex4484_71]
MKFVKKSKKGYTPTKEGKKEGQSPPDVYKESKKNRVEFWAKIAREEIDWIKPFKKKYSQKKDSFSWFEDGKLNLCYNALDRHLKKRDRPAIIFIPENQDEKKIEISYKELYKKVNEASALLKKKGVKKEDIVAIYMPPIPEALIFMLACARIGAAHSVVFSAFSPEALRMRIQDGGAKVLVTSNYYFRKGKKMNLSKKVRKACKGLKIKKIVIDRKKAGKTFKKKNPKIIEPEPMNAEDLAFILYTSGTTGKPKGVMHAVGGYTLQAYTSARYIFNLREGERMWCTADIGWITGHTYTCYGPLLNGATTILYEGLLTFPKQDRFLKIIRENKVNAFYTAPTALRMFAINDSYTQKYKNNSLKVLGTVGEPIDEETWNWFFKKIGKGRCPIVDTYWQTETGAAVIASLPGHGPFIPSYAGKPFPGIEYTVINNKRKKASPYEQGLLVQSPPFSPSLIRGVWKNKKRYKKYFIGKYYNASDNAFYDKEGNFRILGRSDDIIKVAGHRMSTAEIENVIESLPKVVEAAIVGKEDKIKGTKVIAFVRTKSPISEKRIIKEVSKKIGPISKPSKVYFVKDIPKTRSGKMMRRILKGLLEGNEIKNTSTLINPESVREIKEIINKN